jgi:hypothetical protein
MYWQGFSKRQVVPERRGTRPHQAERHCNIANNDLQVFFFVSTSDVIVARSSVIYGRKSLVLVDFTSMAVLNSAQSFFGCSIL